MQQEYTRVVQQIREFIQDTLSTAGFSRVVVNLSGAVDSAVTAGLAPQAVGSENLFLAMMPYGELGNQSVYHAMLVVEALQIPQEQCLRIDIQRAVDAFAEQTVALDRIRRGNI